MDYNGEDFLRRIGHFLALSILVFYSIAFTGEGKIVEIRVEGARLVGEDAIRDAIHSSVASPLSRESISNDLKRLYELGYFKDIQVEIEEREEGVILIYRVIEKPVVKAIHWEGNKKVKTEDLQEVLEIHVKDFYDPGKIQASIDRFRNLYVEEGYFLAEIERSVEEKEPGEMEITFRFKEKDRVKVRHIYFSGYSVFSEKELKKMMVTREAGLFSFLSSSGRYDEDLLDRDRLALSSLYFDQGYIQHQINGPRVTLSPDRRWVDIFFTIKEGEQFFVGDVQVQGDLLFTERELLSEIETKTSEVFSRSQLGEDIGRLTDRYASLGFAFTDVSPLTRVDEEKRRVDVTFDIRKGDLVYFDEIRMSGNTKTRDKVIRREMKIVEGQVYDSSGLHQSKERIEALGFFEEMNITTEPTREDLMDVLVQVKEGQTGTLSAGFGYSTVDQLVGTLRLSLGNLFGRGQRVSLNTEFGGRREFFDFSFFEPYLFDTRWSTGISLFRSRREFTEFTRASLGGTLRLGYKVGDYTRVFSSYRYEDVEITDILDGALSLIEDGVTSSISLSWAYDSRNHPYDTSRGSVHSVAVERAGDFLGGDFDFTKLTTSSTYYRPLFWKTVLALGGRFGYGITDERDPLPFSERFRLGGINTLRGFDFQTIGSTEEFPSTLLDRSFSSETFTLGGNKMLLFNVELLFPIVEQAKVKGLLFLDTGNAFSEEEQIDIFEFRESVGVGVRWFSPLGPLRFEWGFPLDRQGDEKSSQFEFSIGTFF
ncbi:MAG: outer membrane protein assembly factor BamA [Deltaproteobacteria bacterium]|nr:outer membrane protein assembly factor BamA [Deltaproteobacteria bacterium]